MKKIFFKCLFICILLTKTGYSQKKISIDSTFFRIVAKDKMSSEVLEVFYVKILGRNKQLLKSNSIKEVNFYSHTKKTVFWVGFIGYKRKKIKISSKGNDIFINALLEYDETNFPNPR